MDKNRLFLKYSIQENSPTKVIKYDKPAVCMSLTLPRKCRALANIERSCLKP